MVGKYHKIKFLCSPDQGMYDALNKGLDYATGEIIGFLNTDDLYGENVFNEIAKYFHDNSLMAVAGEAIVVVQHPGGVMEIVDKYSSVKTSLMESSMLKGTYFNAWFFRKNVFERIGKFDIRYKIAGDLDFMLRFALNNLSFVSIRKLVYIYQQHEGSLTFSETGQKRITSAKENLVLADSYLHNQNLPKQAKRLVKNLHSRETAELVLRSIWARKIKDLYLYSKEGMLHDILWPLRFFMITAIILPKFFLKKHRKFLIRF